MQDHWHSCHRCGLIHEVDAELPLREACCVRCGARLAPRLGNNVLAALFSVTGLCFYPAAMLLPMMRVERLGHLKEDSLISGVIAMLAEGYLFIGIVVFLFSVLLPPFKLLAIWYLATQRSGSGGLHHGRLYAGLELLEKWSMLDVMLMAVLIAFVKLGDFVEIHAGLGLTAFGLMVLLSLGAGLAFNPRHLWSHDHVE